MTAELTAGATHGTDGLEELLARDFAAWQVEAGGCALVSGQGIAASAGDIDEVLPWASVTKVLAALAVLSAVEDGLLSLSAPAGPPGSTVRHLLAHASGLAFNDERVVVQPGTRRIYSNVGIDLVADLAAERAGAASPAELITERVLRPLGMDATRLIGAAAHGAVGPVRDLARLAVELVQPTLLPVQVAATPAFPRLAGVLPGYGRQTPNAWGLGLEIRGTKSPHWMPGSASKAAFGHFGQAGSFIWVDPSISLAAVAATGTAFGPWAVEAWPASSARWRAAWLARAGASGGVASTMEGESR